MQFRRLSLTAAALLLAASAGTVGARAADIAAPAADLWTGFYLGAQAGYLSGTGGDTDFCESVSGSGRQCLSDLDGFSVNDTDMDGVTAGGYLGYNYRIDSFLLGLEGDFNWDNANGNGDNIAGVPAGGAVPAAPNPFTGYDMSLNWDASVRARLGVIVDERALLYVTGGPSWINVELDPNICGLVPSGLSCGDKSTEFGWQLGAGAEYMITDHLSMKAEYVHGWYGDADLDVVSGSGNKFYIKQDLQTNLVRAGVAYHFGGL